MSRHRHPYTGGIILILIGLFFLLDNLGVADLSDLIHTYWPLILVVIGVSLLLRRSERNEGATTPGTAADQPGPAGFGWETHRRHHTVSTNADDRVFENSTFGDVMLVLTSKNFQGGSVSTVFGDTEVDASMIEPAPGEQVLRIHTVFGDTRISIPKGLALRVSADTSFGNMRVMNVFKDGMFQHIEYTSDDYATAVRKVHLVVSHVFGDLRVW